MRLEPRPAATPVMAGVLFPRPDPRCCRPLPADVTQPGSPERGSGGQTQSDPSSAPAQLAALAKPLRFSDTPFPDL